MIHRAVSMAPHPGLAPVPRTDARCHRALHRVHGIVDGVESAASLLDRFWRDGPLHRPSWVRRSANTARNEQPGEETHIAPQLTRSRYALLLASRRGISQASLAVGADIPLRPVHIIVVQTRAVETCLSC
jgi:hypothetical protein